MRGEDERPALVPRVHKCDRSHVARGRLHGQGQRPVVVGQIRVHECHPVVVGGRRVNDQRHRPWLVSSIRLHSNERRPGLIRGVLHRQRERPGLIVAGGVRDQKLPRVARYHPETRTDVLQRRHDGREALTRVQHLGAYREVQLMRLLHYVGVRRSDLLLQLIYVLPYLFPFLQCSRSQHI